MEEVKKGWGDITLEMFQELSELEQSDDAIDNMLNELSIITGIEYEELEKRTWDDLIEIYKEYEFIKVLPEEAEIKIIELDGEEYGLADFKDLSLAQFIDADELIKDGVIKNLHKIMAILYNPITKKLRKGKYLTEEYVIDPERENLFLTCGMDKIYPTLLFFYRVVKLYLMVIQYSLMEQTQMETILTGAKMKMAIRDLGEEQLETLNNKLKMLLDNNGLGIH